MDKLTIWFRPTGWRPAGFDEKYPVKKISDVYNFEKFNPQASKELYTWSIIQYLIFAFLVFYCTQNISSLGMSGIVCLAIFVFVQVFSATELMNRNKRAVLYSFISTLVCFGIYFFDNSWFDMKSISNFFPLAFLFYFVLQTVMAYKFGRKVYEKEKLLLTYKV